jgi:hypothetical protein
MPFYVLILLALCLTPFCHARTWTSTDGRTIEADLIAKSPTHARLRMTGGGQTVNVPLERLSEADRKFVSQTPTAAIPVFDQAAFQKLIAPLPSPSVEAPLNVNHNDIVQTCARYDRAFASITQTTIPGNIKIIRAMIDTDLKRLIPITSTSLANPPRLTPLGNWTKGGGAWAEVYAARALVPWIKGPVESRLVALERLAP